MSHTSNNNIQKWNAEHGSGPGRGKGNPNKVTTRIKEAFALLLEQRMDNLGEMIDRIAVDDPKAAVDLIVRISERFVPKLTQTSLTNSEGGPVDIKFEFGKKIQPETNQEFDVEDIN